MKMGVYVKWSWLMYMATVMWSSLIVNDWNNDFKNDNIIEFIVNKTVMEVTIEEQRIEEPIKVANKNDKKLKPPDTVSIVDDTSPKITLEEQNTFKSPIPTSDVIFEMLECSTWWSADCLWNFVTFFMLGLSYIILNIFWKHRRFTLLNKKILEKQEVLSVSNSFTQHKKLMSKIPTYKFKRSMSDINIPLRRTKSGNFELKPCISEPKKSQSSTENPLIQEIKDYKKKLVEEEEMCFNLRQELIHIHDERERDRENLARKLEAVIIEKKELSKQLASVLKDNNVLKHDFDEITKAKNDITRKLNKITDELRKTTTEKYNLNKQMIVMRKENSSLRQSLEASRRDMQKHQQKVMELEKEILQLKSRLQCAIANRKKIIEPLKEKPERLEKDLLKPSKGESNIRTPRSLVSPDELNMLTTSHDLSTIKPVTSMKFDLYSNVQNRLKNLENDIVKWETKNVHESDFERIKQDDNTQISEIFHTCCDNSNDESSEYGLTTDAFYPERNVKYYGEEFQTPSTDSTTISTTSENDLPSSEKPSTAHTDELNIDDPAFEMNFNEEYNRLMEKIEHTETTSDAKGIITKQTTFLRKYFQDTSNGKDGFNYFSNDIENLINNHSSEKTLSSKCRVGVSAHVQEKKIPNSLAYKLLTNFDQSWQSGRPIGTTIPTSSGPTSTNNSPRSGCDNECDDSSDLYSLD